MELLNQRIYASAQGALPVPVPECVEAVGFVLGDHRIKLVAYFNGVIPEDAKEIMSCMFTEMCADLFTDDTEWIEDYIPGPFTNSSEDDTGWIYQRIHSEENP